MSTQVIKQLSFAMGLLYSATSLAANEKITVQAESFNATGGTYNGFQIYSANGVGAINYNQTGDWADYTISVATSGIYSMDIFAGTPMTGAAIEVFLNGASLVKKSIPNNGNWDTFSPVALSQTIALTAGQHTLRLQGAGTANWEWNADRFELTRLSNLPASSSASSAAINLPVVIQAENYTATGGTFAGFQKYTTAAGVGAINYNQTGDWVDYNINVPAGRYQVAIAVGTPMANAGVELLLDANSVAIAPIANNGSWDVFALQTIATNVAITAGSHNLRLLSSGAAGEWQWNADRLVLTKLSDIGTSSAASSVAKSSVAPSSVPKSSVAPSSAPKSSVAPSSVAKSSVALSSVPKSSSAAASSVANNPNRLNVSGTFSLEAENYHALGGKVETEAADGGIVVNYFNAGDYLEFYINLDVGGLYQPSFRIATGTAKDVAVGLKVTNHLGALADRGATNVPATTWTNYQTLNAATEINIYPGHNTIRITGAGAADFQFNSNYFTFTRKGALNPNLDGDKDGIRDTDDICPSSPSGETANVQGCTPSQLDTDKDGINDKLDQCPGTAVGTFVDAKGCYSSGGDDDDFDGVYNKVDQCKTTPRGDNVDTTGCSLSAGFDSDNDGVANAIDTCANTPAGEFANEKGCSSSQVTNGVTAKVNVNANIRRSVNGVSNFDRKRHMNVHTAIHESDWNSYHDRLNYLMNTLDTNMGRDNGSATWRFKDTIQDPNKPNWPDMNYMVTRGKELREGYEASALYERFENKTTDMVAGTNPHPTFPTLSWNGGNAVTYDGWQPQTIETSAAWVAQYLANYYANASNGYVGEPMPKYWEVINEPDMLMMTGQFMATSQEKLWEYHNLVAKAVRAKLGNEAPKIGGMTWGLHDLHQPDGLSRFADNYYEQWLTGDVLELFRNATRSTVNDTSASEWYQWDVMWKGFMDAAGSNMDFYSVHLYDWPGTNVGDKGTIRRGAHSAAVLDLMEWYDVTNNGLANRKTVVLSEYGAVNGNWNERKHEERFDIENLKAFNSILMQALERPDYVTHSVPFTPIRPLWGYYSPAFDGCGYKTPRDCTAPYHYSMMFESTLNNGDWQWSSYIKFYELWADVNGTRVDSQSTDLDVQVDSYVDGNNLFVIINNLENKATTVNLNMVNKYATNVQNVELRQMMFHGNSETLLDRRHMKTAPKTVTLAADGTIVLKYTFASNVNVDQQLTEKKYFGNSVSGSFPDRISMSGGAKTLRINNVTVPTGYAEATLRLTIQGFDSTDDVVGGQLTIDNLKVNGIAVTTPIDWRGPQINNASRYFGTLEIPVPTSTLKASNTIEVTFHHGGQLAVANLVVKEFSATPAR